MRKHISLLSPVLIFGCDRRVRTQVADDIAPSRPSPTAAMTMASVTGVPVTVLGHGEAFDINERSQVVGYSWNDAGQQIAVM